jgi:hypothetical protein
MVRNIVRLLVMIGSVSGLSASLVMQARADTYVYDQFGRLKCVAFTAGGHIVYEYDPAGNRTSKVDSTSSSCP